MALSKRITGCVQSRTHVSAIAGIPVFVEPERAIETAGAIVPAHKFTVGEHSADAGLFTQVATDSANREISPLSARRIIVWNNPSGRTVVRDKEAQVPGTLLASQPDSKCRISNSASKTRRGCRKPKAISGASKKFEFSMKNGRFSGKKTSNRWLIVFCGSSDSTCAK